MQDLLAFAGWYFLPNFVTGHVQNILYTVFIRAGDPKPAPGSVRHTRDRRRIYVFVILAYLCYTIYEADCQLRKEGDFYNRLGVSHDVAERAIQSKFRRLTVQFHPDKIAGGDKAESEAHYVSLQLARDTLVDPVKRFAYDRFGPEILHWHDCKTIHDYIMRGLQQTGAYYGASLIGLVSLGMLGYLKHGRFWRFYALAAFFVLELHVAMNEDFPMLLRRLINPFFVSTGLRDPYLPYQMLSLGRKLAVTFFIAMNQLGPLINSSETPSEDTISAENLNQLNAITENLDRELSRLMELEIAPFASEATAARDLKTALKEWLVQNTVKNDPDVKEAIAQVLASRRAENEAGAPPPVPPHIVGVRRER